MRKEPLLSAMPIAMKREETYRKHVRSERQAVSLWERFSMRTATPTVKKTPSELQHLLDLIISSKEKRQWSLSRGKSLAHVDQRWAWAWAVQRKKKSTWSCIYALLVDTTRSNNITTEDRVRAKRDLKHKSPFPTLNQPEILPLKMNHTIMEGAKERTCYQQSFVRN